MTVHSSQITVQTAGENDMHDLTEAVREAISQSGCQNGIVTVFVAHTTAAMMISEYEPGLLADIHLPLERISPAKSHYRHNDLNADDNAHSHLLGSIIGPSITVPFVDRRLTLGTWQRIVLLELDTRGRRRSVVIQVMGE